MRKIVIKYIIPCLIFCSVITMTTSCNKWLNVSPKADMKAEELFKTESGFRDALTGVYALMASKNGYAERLSYGYLDVLAQYYSNPKEQTSGGYDHFYKYAASYDYKRSEEEGRIASIWSLSYQAIANVNMALQYVDKNQSVFKNNTSYSVYKAEFLALRGFLHFDILRLFGSSPKMKKNTGLDQPAIPYIELFTNAPQPQLTVSQALDKVITDLTTAKELMTDKDLFGVKKIPAGADTTGVYTRVLKLNRMAVTALLARVYLYKGDMVAALKEAKEIIGEANGANPTALELTVKPATLQDPMFESEMLFKMDVPGLKNYIETTFRESLNNTSSVLLISSEAKDDIFDVSGNNNDYRLPWLQTGADGKTHLLTKYNDMKYVPILKLSEVYLIAAEAAGGDEGVRYLNKLRAHRGLVPILDPGTLGDEIRSEYLREFMGEGQMFFYYKRFVATWIDPTEDTYVGEAVYNLPIPTAEVDYGNIN